ncbi:MAG: CocE/NonD family hydrolase [Anaerolineales bacterium]|nr:CocE/NonD family hydrolase [Anaerolineales bacterium]
MKKMFRGKRMVVILAAILLLVILLFVFRPKQEPQGKVSEFGQYHGYTNEEYDGYERTSEYLTMGEGTRLAYDLYLPTIDGIPADEPLPTLFKYTPYNRALTTFDENGHCDFCDFPGSPWYAVPMATIRKWIAGNVQTTPGRTAWVADMLKSGYAVVVVDRPQTGASFGKWLDVGSTVNDLDEILNWIAGQEWCDGNIGMFGDSINARVQFVAATTGNPHLKAILPATTWMDQYSATVYPGGVWNNAFMDLYPAIQFFFDEMATPVDSDTDGTLLDQARAERGNKPVLAEGAKAMALIPFRDRLTPEGDNSWISRQALYPLLEKINQEGVPVYLINGWYDIYARDNFMTYENLNVPKRLLVRPTDHAGIEAPGSDVDFAAEAHRWFDYWLKGIDNGIMDEPPIHYYLQGAEEMQSSEVWPLEEYAMIQYYFGPGDNPGEVSINDGTLNPSPPTGSQASDAYTVDYSPTTGETPHWTGLAFPHKYPNMRDHDAKCLTYTTSPLTDATNIVGHPVIHLWLRTEAPDLDAFVYLEEVDGKNSTYVTQGILRASHRTPGQAPFENFGLPWFDHFESELQPIPAGEPFEMVFDLFPTAYQFTEGNRIRTTICFADDGNFDTPILDPPPALNLLRNNNYQTFIELPVVQNP